MGLFAQVHTQKAKVDMQNANIHSQNAQVHAQNAHVHSLIGKNWNQTFPDRELFVHCGERNIHCRELFVRTRVSEVSGVRAKKIRL